MQVPFACPVCMKGIRIGDKYRQDVWRRRQKQSDDGVIAQGPHNRREEVSDTSTGHNTEQHHHLRAQQY